MIVQENFSLKNYNTFGIEVYAKQFVELKDKEDFILFHEQQLAKTAPLFVLGGGSNLLLVDDVNGLVVKVANKGITKKDEGNEVVVTAMAGEVWNELVSYCVNENLSGIENLTLIPGSVGASPIQNIGAYGVELKDVFEELVAFNLSTGGFEVFKKQDCVFAYRESIFKNALKNKYIIYQVSVRLKKCNSSTVFNTSYGAIEEELQKRNIHQPTVKDISKVVAHIRVSKLPDPSTIGNSGSFFKNPIIENSQLEEIKKAYPGIVSYAAGTGQSKVAAGWLIEHCGFKGVVEGAVGTWKHQALVIVNHGGATGKEIYEFSEKIIQTVHQTFGIQLEREVNVVGGKS